MVLFFILSICVLNNRLYFCELSKQIYKYGVRFILFLFNPINLNKISSMAFIKLTYRIFVVVTSHINSPFKKSYIYHFKEV